MFNQISPRPVSNPAPILYLGDTSLDSAACYLAGVMAYRKLGFDYFSGVHPLGVDQIKGKRDLYIISDFMAERLRHEALEYLLQQIRSGAGLLMIGGWESFCGLGGNWAGTAIAAALPVEISTRDDRINFDQVALVTRTADHPILDGLPWDERPPVIGGFNRFRARPEARVLLEVVRHRVCRDGDHFRLEKNDIDPLLVVGDYGRGRTAALATDLAPHWVGPLVDWGTENSPDPSGGGRISARAEGAEEIEVGCLYAQFVYQLLAWTGRFA